MASIQKFSRLGYRIHWRLYFPNGTNKEKYKASRSKHILQDLLPEIMKIESLSRRNEIAGHDLLRALNLGIIDRPELEAFNPYVDSPEDHYITELRADFETKSRAESSTIHCHSANLYKANIIESHFENITMRSITPELIEDFRAKRKQTVTPTTINQDLKCLRKYLDIAVHKGYLKENPARKVKLLREPTGRIPRCLYPDEIKLFFNGMKIFTHWLHGDLDFIMRCLIYTGLRRSELCNLKPENVKLHLRQIHLIGKGKKARVVGINRSLLKEFKHRVKRGYVIDPTIHPGTISRAFKKISRKLGLSESLTLHSLRHTYISYLLEAGIPAKRVKERAGHFNLSITEAYTHALPSKRIDEDTLNFD
jgi:site-specific recombinase XerD